MNELKVEVESQAMTESQMEVETNSSSQESLPKPQAMYRCKKCRRIVAIEENIVPHEPGKGEECFAWKKRSGNYAERVQCSSVFVEPMKWMQNSKPLLYIDVLTVSQQESLHLLTHCFVFLQYMMELLKRSFFVWDVTPG